MSENVELKEIHTTNPTSLVLHPEALATPKMSEEGYDALKLDIETRGQIEPVVVYRGKIVDGRHRWLILQELGIDSIKYEKMPNNSTLTQIKDMVNSKETRRHESAGQLAIRAYRIKIDSKSPYGSFAESAAAVGANRKRVSEAKKIVEVYGRNDILDQLFDGQKFNTGTIDKPFWTDSLGTILNWLGETGSAVNKSNKAAEINPREELTEDEQFLVTEYVNILNKESVLVRKHIVDSLYTKLKIADE